MEARNTTSGVKHYSLKGKDIAFNPSDIDWADRFTQMLDNLEVHAQFTDEEIKLTDESPRDLFRISREKSKAIRDDINELFGDGVAEAYYDGNYLNIEDGFPIWMNFSLDIVDEVDKTMTEQQRIGNERLAKYTKKYEKYKRKR